MRAADDLLALIDARARGLPLFIHSMLQRLQVEGGLVPVDDIVYPAQDAEAKLPAGLRPLLEASLGSLTPEARAVAELLAVAGGSLALELLGSASGLDAPVLFDVLAELRAHRLLAERAEARAPAFDLAQPLAQHAIHDGLAEATRRRMHERLIRAIEEDARPDVVRLAHHYRGLGTNTNTPERSIAALSAAADDAGKRIAHRERAQWLSAAATLLRTVGPDAALRRTLIELGHAWRKAGEARAAVEVWREALALAPSGGAIDVEAAAVWSHAVLAAWDARGYDECETLLTRGLEALEPRGPSHALARLYLAKLTVRARGGDRVAVEALAERMAHPAFCELSGDSEFQIRLARFHLAEVRGHYQRAMTALRDASAVAREPEQRVRVQYLIAGGALMHGDHRGAEPVLDGIEALLSEHGLVAFRPIVPMYRALAAQLRGRWDDAAFALHEALATCSRAGGARWMAAVHATRAMLLALRGDLPEAAEDLQRASAHTGAFTEWAWVAEIARITIELEREELEAALELASGLEPIVSGPGFEAVRAEALIRGGHVEAGEAAARALAGSRYADALAARLRGLAAAARGDMVAAHGELTIAVETFDRLEIPFEAARGRLDRAGLRHADKLGRISDAERAAATFLAVGAQRYADRTGALLKALGVKPPVRRRARASRELSARELEVARLAASRLTNAEIATRLFLSPHTVATHIKRIYERLEVSSRTALARRLEALGLATGTG